MLSSFAILLSFCAFFVQGSGESLSPIHLQHFGGKSNSPIGHSSAAKHHHHQRPRLGGNKTHPSRSTLAEDESVPTEWFNHITYSSETCGDHVILKQSYPTNRCISIEFGSSVKYTCSEGQVHQAIYSDETCSSATHIVHNGTLNFCFVGDADDDGYVNNVGAYEGYVFSCTSGESPTKLEGNSLTRSLFTSSDCEASSIVYFEAALQDYCYANSNGTVTSSNIYSGSNVTIFNNNTECDVKAMARTFEVSPACQRSEDVTASVPYYTTYAFYTQEDTAITGGSSDNSGTIIAAVLGTLGGLALGAVLVWYFMYRKKSLADGGNNYEIA